MLKFLYKKPKPSSSKYEYKLLHDFETRRKESERIKLENPNKVPIIVEISDRSNDLQDISKHIWIIDSDVTIGQFLYILRVHIKLNPNEALFLFVNNMHIPATSETLGQTYKQHHTESKDGWLYVTLSTESCFGSYFGSCFGSYFGSCFGSFF